jgi:hypothetical protein
MLPIVEGRVRIPWYDSAVCVGLPYLDKRKKANGLAVNGIYLYNEKDEMVMR